MNTTIILLSIIIESVPAQPWARLFRVIESKPRETTMRWFDAGAFWLTAAGHRRFVVQIRLARNKRVPGKEEQKNATPMSRGLKKEPPRSLSDVGDIDDFALLLSLSSRPHRAPEPLFVHPPCV